MTALLQAIGRDLGARLRRPGSGASSVARRQLGHEVPSYSENGSRAPSSGDPAGRNFALAVPSVLDPRGAASETVLRGGQSAYCLAQSFRWLSER